MSDNERVLCVPRTMIEDGVLTTTGDKPERILAELLSSAVYLPRNPVGEYGGCEQDERFLQLLPYIVVVNDKGELLCYQRRKGGEKRLDGLWSIGIGGHVNDGDADWMAGVNREAHEELSWGDDPPPIQFLHGPIGFIFDDSNAVGRVHLGVLYVLEVPEGATYREHEVWDFSSFESVESERIENWSVIALPMVRTWLEAKGRA